MLALVIAAAMQAASPESGSEPPLAPPDVSFQVDDAGIRRFYPEAARRARVEGSAVANCVIMPSGHLQNCTLEAESPEGHGFGKATLLLLSRMRIAEKAGDGSPTAGRKFHFPMRFKLPR
jgi:TonB family protein